MSVKELDSIFALHFSTFQAQHVSFESIRRRYILLLRRNDFRSGWYSRPFLENIDAFLYSIIDQFCAIIAIIVRNN